ncbi:ABC transporter substrate-binding protein [Achromobacter sp. Marseille-Q0513]|uniref:ABC transporter substrate-binding protein n=1 Tax=Achromobacter sp. Marseille-Q0513 TaxID=2829161 RepID=UPI001B9AED61|nr:ABC transporter substrate-binding protein [Achromobacter sp. Marseille-Q0513]MBR8652603.1 ABC transporter substrate-binding protein [Achromobacter sp. Marseille-Q0513]
MRLSAAAKDRFAQVLTSAGLALVLAVLALASPSPAQAEGRIRIAEQYGIVYLLLNVARDQQLIEKHGKAEGVDISVEWAKLSGGSAVNDALLSGAVDIAGAGVGPLLTIWDRTRGKQNVKGVASLGNFPYYLVTNNPNVKSIADFTERDRIALPAVGVSVQSRVLQLASAKLWGDAHYDKLDKISVALPHPDAAAAIIAGGTEITGHFGNPPFQEQELAENPKARIVLNSYDVLGGPSSSTVLFATEKFRKDNPKTYKAFQLALQEAAEFATANPEKAADTYLRVTGAKLDRDFLIKIIKNPDVQFKLAPQNTYTLAQFMHKVGAIKTAPASWREYFFDDAVTAQGS